VGKTTTARILAKAINCLNPIDFEPCNQCEICKSINDFNSLDIIEIDAASNRGIDDVRNLRESVKYAPTLGKYKVYIVDEVHMLTTESFNALLKTLEEPPAHVVFIFATTDIHKVPLTIISRCQRFDFRRISLNTIKEQLKKIAIAENISIDDKALTIIAKKSDGAMRDAQSYFDQIVAFCGNVIEPETVAKILNIIDQDIFFKISDAIINKDFPVAFDVIELIHNNGWDFTDFLDGLTEHFRNILSVLITGKTNLIETAEIYQPKYLNYLNNYAQSDVLRILNFLIKNQSELKFSNNKKVRVEIILSHLIALQNTATISELIDEIKKNSDLTSDSKKKVLIDNNVRKKSETSAGEKISEAKSESVNQNLTKTSTEVHSLWERFVEEVFSEKTLVLGNIFKSIKLQKIDINTIFISDLEPESKELLELNLSYLEKKLYNIFGKRMKLEFLQGSGVEQSSISNTAKDYSDPIEKFIIEELGGKRIS
jgi:DNA polymerase-3 subunit gamma/tau